MANYHPGQKVKVTITSAEVSSYAPVAEILNVGYRSELGTYETDLAVDSADVAIEACSCGTPGTEAYEGPQQDCVIHGNRHLVPLSRRDLTLLVNVVGNWAPHFRWEELRETAAYASELFDRLNRQLQATPDDGQPVSAWETADATQEADHG